MTAAVWSHDGPLGAGPGAVRLPSETVREVWRTHYWTTHKPESPFHGRWDLIPDDIKRERVVSSVVDLPEETCPDGWHKWAASGHLAALIMRGEMPDFPRSKGAVCSTCGGTGKIRRLWHAVEQCQVGFNVGTQTAKWDFIGSDKARAVGLERRLVVVGYSDTQQVDGELRWESVVMLDQPITRMAYPDRPKFHKVTDRPLQVVPGWNPSVELETP